MPINNQYDPLSISEITNRQIDAKNRRSVAQVDWVAKHKGDRHTTHSNKNPDHIKSELDFLGLLLQPEKQSHSTDTFTSLKEKKESDLITGTNEFFSPPKKCEQKNRKSERREFNFCIQNTQAGEVHVRGEFDGKKCIVLVSLKSKLSTQEQIALEKILRVGLGKSLGVDLEIKID